MPAEHLVTGRSGEEAALNYLKKLGYRILETNWRCGHLEIDIICEDSERLVFVEVKTRDSQGFVQPIQTLGREKQSRLVRAAWRYLQAKQNWARACRFDFIAVKKNSQGFEVQYVPNAFDNSMARSKPGGNSNWQPW